MANTKYARGADGYFQTKVWDGTYVNGTKHRVSLRTKKSSKELENMVIEHNQRMKERSYIRKSDVTFIEYAKEWKKVYKANLSKNTQAMYDNIIEKHFVTLSCKISDINRIHYFMLINAISGTRTQQQASMTFKQIIKSAIKDKLLPASVLDEIFDDAVKIKYKSPEKRALTENEKQAVFSNNLSLPDKTFLYILYGCGLRRGEALALTRFNINLERKELTVNNSLAFDNNTPYLKDTKTVNGVRTIPIPDIVIDTLKSYLDVLKGTILFPSKSKGYMTKSSYIKMWKRIIKGLNQAAKEPITGLTAHIFRHNYCASLCYMIPEISIGKIAELLGDTDRMVIEVYNHVIEKKEKPHSVVENALAL